MRKGQKPCIFLHHLKDLSKSKFLTFFGPGLLHFSDFIKMKKIREQIPTTFVSFNEFNFVAFSAEAAFLILQVASLSAKILHFFCILVILNLFVIN